MTPAGTKPWRLQKGEKEEADGLLPILTAAKTPDSDLSVDGAGLGVGVLVGPQDMSKPYFDIPRLNSYRIHLGKHVGSGEGSFCPCHPKSPGIWRGSHKALREVREACVCLYSTIELL